MAGLKRKHTTQRMARPLKRRRVSQSTAALRLARKAYRCAKPEVKVFDSAQTGLYMIRSGTRTSLIGDNSTEFQPGQDIVQGTGDDHRVGDKIRSKSIYLKYRVYIPDNFALNYTEMVRIMLIKTKLPNGSSLSVTDVYNDLGVDPILARRNTEKASAFTVLYDKTHKLRKDDIHQQYQVNKYIKLNEEVVFNASSQKINKNAYFLVYYSEIPPLDPSNPGATATPRLDLFFRYAFTDV